MKEYNNDVDKARKYLRNLELKLVVTENPSKARVLEQVLIHLLKPKFNTI